MSPYLRQHRPLIAGSFLALLAGVLMRALEPWPLKIVIDHVIIPGSSQTLGSSWINNLQPLTVVAGTSLALILIVGLRALSTYLQKVGFALVGNKVLTQVRAVLYRHIQCLSLAFHNKAKSGDLLVRVIGDIGLLKEVAVTAFMPLIGSLLVLSLMGALMLWLNWKLALLVLLSAPLFWLPTLILGKRIRAVSRKQRKREGAMASTAAESIGAMQVVQTLSLEETFADQFGKQNKKSLKEGVKMKRLLAKLQGTVQLMTGVSTAIVLFYGTVLVLRGSLTAGELLVFLSYLKAAFKPIQDFAKYSGRIAKASAAGERVIQLLETPADVTDEPEALPAPTFLGKVSFNHVSYSYADNHDVLKDINFCIPAGQKVAIVGPSGAGKSTMIGLISRLYDPVRGEIMFDDTNIRNVTLESLRMQVSVVLQDTLLFATSIEENIAYGAPDSSAEEVREAARLANIHDFIESLPDGYATQVGERGVTLSVGQRQRIAVARAALRKAPLLILDEPTSSLDKENRHAVLQALNKISSGRTTFMITHDLEEIEHADVILHIENGILIESGSHTELMNSGGTYRKLVNQEYLNRDNDG
jgi:ATP-binding cassette subfamily B protein